MNGDMVDMFKQKLPATIIFSRSLNLASLTQFSPSLSSVIITNQPATTFSSSPWTIYPENFNIPAKYPEILQVNPEIPEKKFVFLLNIKGTLSRSAIFSYVKALILLSPETDLLS